MTFLFDLAATILDYATMGFGVALGVALVALAFGVI